MFELDLEPTVKTVKQLLRRFYKLHSYRVEGKCKGVKPNAFILNPVQFVDPTDPCAQDKYYVVYTRGYYVVVERNENSLYAGPHAAKLHLEITPGKIGRAAVRVHLGTIQINQNFYTEPKIKKALRLAIQRREYFCSPTRLEQWVEIDES